MKREAKLLCCMEDKNDISIASQLSPATIPDGSLVEAKEPNLCGGDDVGAVIDSGGDGGGRVSESVMTVEATVKRKRGRPRKFDLGAKATSLLPNGFSSSISMSREKRGRGRPRGSGRLQLLAALGGIAAETAGGSMIPHVITVNSGEDIISLIISFAQKSPRAVCVLSATGVVSSVIIRQPGPSGGILRYEGRFEILSLRGSFTFGVKNGAHAHRKTGMLSVSLAKPDGRVFGGGVVGSLIASGPIQLIVASFKQNISKNIKLRQLANSSTAGETMLADSEIVKCPIQIAAITEGEGNFTNAANTSTVSQQHLLNIDPQEIFQLPQPISGERALSPDMNSINNI